MSWDLDCVEVGDFLIVETVNKQGDRNLDGRVFAGTVVQIFRGHGCAKLDTGWHVHTKDLLLKHRKRGL